MRTRTRPCRRRRRRCDATAIERAPRERGAPHRRTTTRARRESSGHQIANEGQCTRILTLAEPEERLVAHGLVPVVLRDVDELVECFAIASLGEHEGVMVAERRIVELVVEPNEVPGRPAPLTEPEHRLLARVLALSTIGDNGGKPPRSGRTVGLRHGEEDVVAQLL